ncbi:MAG: S8/S53 family peptidase [Bacteroidota bacterium]
MYKYFYFLIGFCWIFSPSIAQDSHFLSREGQQISLQENTSSLCLYFYDPVQRGAFKFKEEAQVSFVRYSYGNERKRVIIDFNSHLTLSPLEAVEKLGISPHLIKSASWSRSLDGGMDMWLTHRVLFESKDEVDRDLLEEIWKSYNGAVSGDFSTGYSYVDIDEIEEVISLANSLYESDLVKWAQPNFAVVAISQSLNIHEPVKVTADSFPTDSLFDKLFYLHNTGQNPLSDLNFWSGGTVDVDIDAPEAWGIETGSPGITVAIVDQGVTDHEDLNDDNGDGSSRLKAGWTADPSLVAGGVPQLPDAAHGIGVAGIIGASHNSIGVAGICPECEIISATAFVDAGQIDQTDPTEIQYLANSINWAWQNGGDVINNSWVLETCATTSGTLFAPIEAAIDDAKSLGRSGLGSVFIFASGQYVGSPSHPWDCVAYPANLPQVIAVGAIDLRGNFPAYANYGPELDIVAPTSRQVGTTPWQGMENSVTTIDLYPDGYNHPTANLNYPNMKYNRYFGGTSTSSSIVSGIVALMLSRNSNLTATEVTNILLNNTVDVGANGFDNQSGFGMANAFDALSATPTSTFPVEYLSFSGKALNGNITLKWGTAQELNNDYFLIEKEFGNNFQSIGEVDGSGTVNGISSYDFIDKSVNLGSNVYRLKQVDFDGEFEYSRSINIELSARDLGLSTRLFPNPAKDEIQVELIELERSKVKISIKDLQGKELYKSSNEIQKDQELILINTAELSSGSYLLEIKSSNGKREVMKFIIAR